MGADDSPQTRLLSVLGFSIFAQTGHVIELWAKVVGSDSIASGAGSLYKTAENRYHCGCSQNWLTDFGCEWQWPCDTGDLQMASRVRGWVTHCLASSVTIVPLIALEGTCALVRPQVAHSGGLELSLATKGLGPGGPRRMPGLVLGGAGIRSEGDLGPVSGVLKVC